MAIAKPSFSNFEEYLALAPSDLPEGRYEYWDGELVAVMPESGLNDAIANYLYFLLVSAGISPPLLRPHSCEIEVPGRPRTRFPDFVILTPAHLPLIARRNTISREMPPPQVVIEVVSPGKTNRDRDLIAKRSQCAERLIPEYWLIDPENAEISVLELTEQGDDYGEIGTYRQSQHLHSPSFPEISLSVAQILSAGDSG
jgi:Uma2 family endonuclease